MSARRRATAIATTVAVLAGACTGDSDDGTATAPPATAVDSAGGGPGTTVPVPDGGTEPDVDPPTTVAPAPAPATDAATTTIGTVPDEGVPGIDSGDAFCRSWSEFAGTFQALAVATAFGSDPAAAARLEAAAAPALVAAVRSLDANLPDELESEREAFVAGLAGPLLRRAERGRSELADAGLSDDAIVELGRAWLATLAAGGLDDPDLQLVVPDGVDSDAFDTAAQALRAELPPINQDPSLITDAETPRTDRYLSLNCPDQGTLAGNDVIDEL